MGKKYSDPSYTLPVALDGTEVWAITKDVAGTLTTFIVTPDFLAAWLSSEGFASTAYVNDKVQGLSWKQQVRAATTTAKTLATDFENGDTIDGVVLATGDRVLIKNQVTASENGIYVVAASGAPTRAADADAGAEIVNASMYVSEGTVNGDTQWTCSTNAPVVLGTTALAFVQLLSAAGALWAANNLSDLASAITARTNLGVYSTAEVDSAISHIKRVVQLAVTDPNGATLQNTTGVLYFRVPDELNGMNLIRVAAAVSTVSTAGNPTVQLNRIRAGVTVAMLSTQLSVDANETDSSTAATAAVINTANDDIATADFIRIDITTAGTNAKGLIVEMVFQLP